jgi:hypothetical protein
MNEEKITKSSNLVKVLVASARNESQDSKLLDEANAYVKE